MECWMNIPMCFLSFCIQNTQDMVYGKHDRTKPLPNLTKTVVSDVVSIVLLSSTLILH